MRGGAAIADALIGTYSPAGRSPVTWYSSDAALPTNRAEMSLYPNASSGYPGLTYRYYNSSIVGQQPPIFTFGEGLSYTTFAVDTPVAPATITACDPLVLGVTVRNTGMVASDVVLQVFLSQAGTSVPSPMSRLVTFARVHVDAGGAVPVTFPPVPPAYRAVIREAGGDANDMFSVRGKRWTEAGTLELRVVTGQHNGHAEGGLSISVTQNGSSDVADC